MWLSASKSIGLFMTFFVNTEPERERDTRNLRDAASWWEVFYTAIQAV